MTDDDYDLLGGPTPKKRGPGRPRKDAPEPDFPVDAPSGMAITLAEIRAKGVTSSWLAGAFQLSVGAVRKRLAACDPFRITHGNTPHYDIREAAAYLVKPNIDLSTLKRSDLPANLQASAWDAKLKEQKWRRNAGELWHTQDVLDVFGDVFLLLKTTLQLFPEDKRLAKTLTDEQRSVLIELIDGLQKEIHSKLVELPSSGETLSSVKEADGNMFDEGDAADEE